MAVGKSSFSATLLMFKMVARDAASKEQHLKFAVAAGRYVDLEDGLVLKSTSV